MRFSPKISSTSLVSRLAASLALAGAGWIGLSLPRAASASDGPQPAIIAEQGDSTDAPEESAAAFLLAREIGADYLEMDLHRTLDGAIIATHDLSLERTTDIREKCRLFRPASQCIGGADFNVGNFTLAEIRRLDIGSYFNRRYPAKARPEYVGLHLLTLEEIIRIAEGEWKKTRRSKMPGLYMELKNRDCCYAGLEEDVVKILKKAGWITSDGRSAANKGPVVFESFYPDVMDRLEVLAPGIPRLLLVNKDELGEWKHSIQTATSHHATGIGPRGDFFGTNLLEAPWIWAQFALWIHQAHNAGLMVHIWTLDFDFHLRFFASAGVDGVFTNRSDLAVKAYHPSAPRFDLPELIQSLQACSKDWRQPEGCDLTQARQRLL